MGWLKKLPRFIRPPKKVRQAIEKVASSGIGGLLSGLKEGGQQVVQTVVKDAQGAADAVKRAEQETRQIKILLAIGLGLFLMIFLFKKMR